MAEPTPPPYNLEHTPASTPYIPLKTRSQVPIYLTKLKESDAQAMANTLSIEALNNALISIPKPYTLDSAKWWINQQRKPTSRVSIRGKANPHSDRTSRFTTDMFTCIGSRDWGVYRECGSRTPRLLATSPGRTKC
jgi:hypothetical protein